MTATIKVSTVSHIETAKNEKITALGNINYQLNNELCFIFKSLKAKTTDKDILSLIKSLETEFNEVKQRLILDKKTEIEENLKTH